jgi:class 3 adenylate cyclase
VIGDTVSLASRVDGLDKDDGSFLLMTGRNYAALGEEARCLPFERIERAAARGKSERAELYLLLGVGL